MTIGNADGAGGIDAPPPTLLVEGSVASRTAGAGFVKYPVEGFFIGPNDSQPARIASGGVAAPRLYPASGYQTSGWCQSCGRRRGADGRCANCDPWWTSPLLMVGLPCVAATCFGLFLLVTALGGKRPVVVATNNSAPTASTSYPAFSAPPSPGYPLQTARALPAPPAAFSLPANSAPAVSVTLAPPVTAQDRFLRRYAEQESLRQTTSFVDAAIGEDARNRERADAQARDGFAAPQSASPASAVPSPGFPSATRMRMQAAPSMSGASI